MKLVLDHIAQQKVQILLDDFYNHIDLYTPLVIQWEYKGGVLMNTEKVSVNVNVVDIGKIELLIEKGIYTNKTDFLTKAITNELNKNENILDSTIKEIDTDVHLQIGKVTYNKEKLLKIKNNNTGMKLYVIGRLTIENDVSLELAKETLLSIKVFGPAKMSPDLKEYYIL